MRHCPLYQSTGEQWQLKKPANNIRKHKQNQTKHTVYLKDQPLAASEKITVILAKKTVLLFWHGIFLSFSPGLQRPRYYKIMYILENSINLRSYRLTPVTIHYYVIQVTQRTIKKTYKINFTTIIT